MSGTALSREQIERRVAELGDWFHNLNLNGVQTAPHHVLGDYPQVKWQRFGHAIPSNLRGRTVLDIGCNAGFYSIAMKQRGADRVVAVDSDPRYLAQARLAAEVLDADIEFREMSVYQLPALEERFDIVLFMGVLYHLRYPLLALDILHEYVTRDLLVFQSMMRGSADAKEFAADYDFREVDHFDDPAYPRLHFIEHRYAGDPTNWWTPNRAGAEAMLRSSGFEVTDHPEEEVFICRRTDRPRHVELTDWESLADSRPPRSGVIPDSCAASQQAHVLRLRRDMAKSRKKGSAPPPSTESIEDVSVAQPGFQPESISEASKAPQSTGDTTAASADRERIAMRAYELYLARGRGEGAAMEDWLRAERELTARSRSSSRDSES